MNIIWDNEAVNKLVSKKKKIYLLLEFFFCLRLHNLSNRGSTLCIFCTQTRTTNVVVSAKSFSI